MIDWPEDEVATDALCPHCSAPLRSEELLLTRDARNPKPAEPPPRFQLPGYEVLGELGRGGMGIVYKARQLGLNRLVAVKMIRAGVQADEEERSRFLAEAKALAHLQHSNIVQVHEITNWQPPDGGQPLPCLVMEFIDGCGLDHYTNGKPQPFGNCAQLIETLARAVHWSHLRGIVHRDLKPANILVGAGADTSRNGSDAPRQRSRNHQHPEIDLPAVKITDFGLAKRLEAGEGQTKTGDVLGTPNYMAPEQARGQIKQIGPGTDVYALGAILYELLTGQPPFRADTAWETIRQVLEREPVPPSRLRIDLPRDLETICLKCLQKEPTNRYATAEDLADDLARFLRYEPISARPVSRVERFLRWYRRESKVARLTTAVVAVSLLALLIIGGLGVRHQEQAHARFDAALVDLDRELAIIGKEEYALIPQNDQLRRQLFEELAAKTEALAADENDNPVLRRKQAVVLTNLGKIRELLGRFDEAEASYRKAADLLASQPNMTSEDDQVLARSYQLLADLLVAIGRFDEAGQLYPRALALQSKPEGSEKHRADRAATLQKLGNLQVMTGGLADGEQSLRKALDLQNQLVAEEPTAARQLAQAQTKISLAALLTTLSQFDEAEPLFNDAIKSQDQLAAAEPAVPVYRLTTARSLRARARMFDATSHGRECQNDLSRASDIFKKLAQDYPLRLDFRLEVAGSKIDTVDIDAEKNHGSRERNYRDAIMEQQRLVEEYPALIENRRRLAVILNTLATWLNDMASYDKFWLTKAVKRAGAIEAHRRSEEIWTALAADYPTVLAYQNGSAMSHQRFGIVLENMGRLDEAESLYAQSIAVQERLVQQFPQVAAHHSLLGALHNNLGVIYDHRRDLKTAEEQFRLALTYSRRAWAINPRNFNVGYILSTNAQNVAAILIRTRRYQQALPLADEMIRAYADNILYPDGHSLKILKQCATAAKNDAALTTGQRSDLLHRIEDQAIDQVKLIVANSTEQPSEISAILQKNRIFDFLRHRSEFQAYCREIAEKRSPKK